MTRTARQKALRKARKARPAARPGCPNPAKKAYENQTAVTVALRRSKASGKPMRIYTCPCGRLHLTSKPLKGGSHGTYQNNQT